MTDETHPGLSRELPEQLEPHQKLLAALHVEPRPVPVISRARLPVDPEIGFTTSTDPPW